MKWSPVITPLSKGSYVILLSLVSAWAVLGAMARAEETVGAEETAGAEETSSVRFRRVSPSQRISLLRQVEARVLPLPLVKGVSRHETLRGYYVASNPGLQHRFDEAIDAFTTGRPRPFRAMTIVSGPAGIGKTFIKSGIYSRWIDEEHIWKFDVRDVFAEMIQQGLAEHKPDLVHGEGVINRLPSLTDAGRKLFVERLTAGVRPFVVVDSLDEIHPDDYFFVLSELEKLTQQKHHEYLHVVVFGRPLAFREFWAARRTQGVNDGLRAYVLRAPDFRTTGDLMVSTWNYDCWKYGVSRDGIQGERLPITLDDFQKWCDCDFDRSGEFSDVRFRETDSICPEVRDELMRWTSESRVVMSVVSNLAGNSILRDIVHQHVKGKTAFDESQFMDEFFARWLERDTKSDDRPSRLKPAHLDVYLKLLEEVAAKYANENRVTRLGYFDVVDEDRVAVDHDGRRVEIAVSTLLNRSGLVNLDPVLPTAHRYRFEPIWLHRLLYERHHDREQQEKIRLTVSRTP
ncbi:MAG: hypothetical protein AAF497_10530 [Planctomycetota bacterium]